MHTHTSSPEHLKACEAHTSPSTWFHYKRIMQIVAIFIEADYLYVVAVVPQKHRNFIFANAYILE